MYVTWYTYFFESFLRSVCGEGSAALMTLDVLDDILRSFCFFFTTVLPPTSSFSSILQEASFWDQLYRDVDMAKRIKDKFQAYENWPDVAKKANDWWQQNTHHGGSLNMADLWKWTNQKRAQSHEVGGARETKKDIECSINYVSYQRGIMENKPTVNL